ncbi:sulfatase-like hydrolase/transferase [Novipirellula herctigrandis]
MVILSTCAVASDKPNIIVVLADDLGYSDLGCYGGELSTPNIDGLAEGGIRFTQVYNSARCCPSRASLMTGLYPSQAGIGDFTTRQPDPNRGPGYLGRLNDQCATIAEVLKPAGYGCYYVGKWHMHPETGPIKRGFDEFYGYTNDHSHDQYDADYYFRLPEGRAKEIDPPADEFYATDVFNEYALNFIRKGQKSEKPWFLFLGHSSPHFPVQAPKERADKYEKVYMRGWDVLREERFKRMQEIGLVDGERWKLSPRSLVPVDRDDIANGFSGQDNPAWDSLDEDRQRDLARRMSVFAAMVEGVDNGVGQIVGHLKETDDLDNTLILFLSDNGACYEWGPFGFDGQSRRGTTTLRTGDAIQGIGGRGTHQSYGSAWANLGNTPFRLYKHFTHEGGISTPFIAHWPKGIGKSEDWVRDPAHVMDIMPTLIEVAGAKYPETLHGNAITPIEGTSLLPAMRGDALPNRTLGFDHQAAHALRKGDWKAVYAKRMPHELKWELYNLAQDRCELNDLAEQQTERLKEMVGQWEEWARHVGVIWKPNEPVAKNLENQGGLDSPQIVNRDLRIEALVNAKEPKGVVIAHGGIQYGYALHFVDGHAAFDVRVDGHVERIIAKQPSSGKVELTATLNPELMTLSVNDTESLSRPSPGLIPVQPMDGMNIGFDDRSAAGDYNAPNPFNGKVLLHKVVVVPPTAVGMPNRESANNGTPVSGKKKPKSIPRSKSLDKPFSSELITKWGESVTSQNAWTEYPRPQLQRKNWLNLNGKWDYAITSIDQEEHPTQWAGQILVPYCLESKLGGVERSLDEKETLWYHRRFDVEQTGDERQLLNFEAVDYRCEVFVNAKSVGTHQGGNNPFSFDITDSVKVGENELVVRVEDATEAFQLRGKQTLEPRGIWYTQVSGIWQTVWLEQVSNSYIQDLFITTDASAGTIRVQPVIEGNGSIRVVVKDDEQVVAKVTASDTVELKIPNAKLWSPSSPHLYKIEVTLIDQQGKAVDVVESYTGIRTVGKIQDADGHWRFTLNGEVLFHFGPLDQGWWPDGLLTPPSDEAMLFDIEWLKEAGFNMIRKHIKVEPRRYYYHCDRLGMMVWQDQVSGGPKPKWTRLVENPVDADWPDAEHQQFMDEFEAMISTLKNYPSIVVWTPFNEAWGQHRTIEVGKWTSKRDPSRLVNVASGGNFWPIGDIVDAHKYPDPGFPFDQDSNGRFDDYIKVVGEFGGHGYPVKGHLWDSDRRNWGYGGLPKDEAEYKSRYVKSIELLDTLRSQGIAAGVYTQTTDVEGEINGLMTYDRKVIKIPADQLAQLHAKLYGSIETKKADEFPKSAFIEQSTDRKPVPVMDPEAIRAGLDSHDRALYIKSGWIRDPYITLGPDDYYYLTGTQPIENDPREALNPYNIGLGGESIVGDQVRVYRSKDLIDWESLGPIFTVDDTHKAANQNKKMKSRLIWAPEIHWMGDRWALVHCPKSHSSLAVSAGKELSGPWTHPMDGGMGPRHDPSLFTDDDGAVYMLWQNTLIAPLSEDLTQYTAEPIRIDPSGTRPAPDGKPISRIGHEGATMMKVGGKYVHLGTAWSTDQGRKGSYNLYYCVADKITGPYGPRKFAGRFLGHGTPFKDKNGKWWCTAFFNANVPPLARDGIEARDLGNNAQTINEQGVTIVPLDVQVLKDGEIYIRAKDPAYKNPGPDEAQTFEELDNPAS